MTTQAVIPPEIEKTPDALVGRLFEASLGMFDIMAVYLGDQLGLYRTLRDGAATSAELAGRAGIDERYAREWLEQQAATGILQVDDLAAGPADRRFSLPRAYVEPLIDKESPNSIAPLARSIVASAKVLPQLMEAFRTGGGVAWADYGPDMIEAQGDFNRPWLVNSFGTGIIPAIPAVHNRLVSDRPVRVADVACGVGWAAISIARAYPRVRIYGFDLDESSIALAQ
ncbi:MAG: class I SAM-dependent methyltransferase, partial [Chloroflexota bacterium]